MSVDFISEVSINIFFEERPEETITVSAKNTVSAKLIGESCSFLTITIGQQWRIQDFPEGKMPIPDGAPKDNHD